MPQVLVLASIMLLIGSLSSVAVPRLSGQLIDISIEYSKSHDQAAAKARANGPSQDVMYHLLTLRTWRCCHF